MFKHCSPESELAKGQNIHRKTGHNNLVTVAAGVSIPVLNNRGDYSRQPCQIPIYIHCSHGL